MTFKFTPGTYLTRDGRKAVVLCDDAPGAYPLKGYIRCGDGGWAADWTCGGRHVRDTADLMPPVTPSFAEVAALIERCPYHDGRDWLWAQMPALKGAPQSTPSEYDRGWNEALAHVGYGWLYGRVDKPFDQYINSLKKHTP